MKKIIIIIPPSPNNKKISRFTDCSLESKASYLYQPIEMMIFTSHLDPTDEMVFIDGTADSLSEEEFLKRVRGARGDILFFSFASMVWKSDYAYFQKVKQCLPDIPVFVIGDICLDKLYRSIILKDCDGLVVNPYSIDLEKMIQARNGSSSVKLPGVCTDEKEEVATSSKKPIHVKSRVPRHEMFSKRAYRHPFSKHFNYATVMTVFGCPFSCSYCPTSNFTPVVRQPEDVLDELRHLKSLGIKELYIADHTFGYPREYSLAIVKEMARSFNFSWSCFLAPQLYNAELLDMMRLAGCHTINIGIESLDSQSLRQQYQRTVGKERIEEVVAHANRLGMSICADFILGLENEDKQDIIDSINYALSIPIDFVSFNVAAPLPGSSIRDKALNESRLLSEREGLDTSGRNRVLGNTLVNNKTLKELQTMAIRKFYLRPSYLLRRLRKTTSWQHFFIQFLQMKELFLSKH